MANLIAPEGFALDFVYPMTSAALLRPEPPIWRKEGEMKFQLGVLIKSQADIDAKVWDLREEMAKHG